MLDHKVLLAVCSLHRLSRIIEVVILEWILVEDRLRNALTLVRERLQLPL